MKLVQGIFYICVKYEFEFSAIHVPGAKNTSKPFVKR